MLEGIFEHSRATKLVVYTTVQTMLISFSVAYCPNERERRGHVQGGLAAVPTAAEPGDAPGPSNQGGAPAGLRGVLGGGGYRRPREVLRHKGAVKHDFFSRSLTCMSI